MIQLSEAIKNGIAKPRKDNGTERETPKLSMSFPRLLDCLIDCKILDSGQILVTTQTGFPPVKAKFTMTLMPVAKLDFVFNLLKLNVNFLDTKHTGEN